MNAAAAATLTRALSANLSGTPARNRIAPGINRRAV